MADGKIFGTSGEVHVLSNGIKACMSALEACNGKGSSMLGTIEGSTSDEVYRQAEDIVQFVKLALEKGQEPLESVVSSLNAYADLLEQHGR